jgi:micrococcal nuclease
MYEYQARCVEVIDGDTQDVVVDLGFHIQRRIRLRLLGVDTHETYGVDHDSEEYRRGKRETEFVAEWLDEAATQHEYGQEKHYWRVAWMLGDAYDRWLR